MVKTLPGSDLPIGEKWIGRLKEVWPITGSKKDKFGENVTVADMSYGIWKNP